VQHNILERKYLIWPHSRVVLAPDCARPQARYTNCSNCDPTRLRMTHN
jgi:hypothetical protein